MSFPVGKALKMLCFRANQKQLPVYHLTNKGIDTAYKAGMFRSLTLLSCANDILLHVRVRHKGAIHICFRTDIYCAGLCFCYQLRMRL